MFLQGTSLLNPPPSATSIAESFGNIGKAAHIVKLIVMAHEWIFDPIPEPEATEESNFPHDADDLPADAGALGLGEAPPAEIDSAVLPETISLPRSLASKRSIASQSSSAMSEEAPPPLPPMPLLNFPSSESSRSVAVAGDETITTDTVEPAATTLSTTGLSASPSIHLLSTKRMPGIQYELSQQQRTREESIYLDAQDALEILNQAAALGEEAAPSSTLPPVPRAQTPSAVDAADDLMTQLAQQIDAIGKSP